MRRFIFRCFKFIVWLFAVSVIYLVICKWVMPPITITQLHSVIIGNGLKRNYVGYDQINKYVKLAAIAGEDQLFPYHHGFDWKALKKSLAADSKRKVRGTAASTISQQTAKNVFLWQGEGVTRYLRKGPEFIYTQLIEWIWGKKRILEVYLNTIEMGKGIYGIEAAAVSYYNKSANSLSRSEAASIIACLPNPKIYTVQPRSKYVNWKTGWILGQMKNIEFSKPVRSILLPASRASK